VLIRRLTDDDTRAKRNTAGELEALAQRMDGQLGFAKGLLELNKSKAAWTLTEAVDTALARMSTSDTAWIMLKYASNEKDCIRRWPD
jgi:hypothetical protein